MIDLTFEVPPGLGDITWCYQKVSALVEAKSKTGESRFDISFRICGDKPHRGSDFVDILPGVKNLGYGRSYAVTKKELLPYDTDLSKLKDGTYAISLNPHLEQGNQIDLAFPKQKINYHFNLNTSDVGKVRAKALLTVAQEKLHVYGFYCSSYAHRPDLGFWSPEEWLLFLQMIQDIDPDATFLALGAQYDDRTLDVYTSAIKAGMRVTSAIGADISTTAELIRGLDYLFAFPSGLAMLAEVVNTPCMMWYWSNILNPGFLNTYADPKNVDNGRHLNLPYLKVLPSADIFEQRGYKNVVGNYGGTA